MSKNQKFMNTCINRKNHEALQ